MQTLRAMSFWLLLMSVAGDALAESSTSAPALYPASGRLYSHQTMTNAYAKVKSLYAVDLDSQQCVPVSQLKAQRLRGTVKLSTVSRLLIKANDGRNVALLGIRGTMPKEGEPVDVMVIRSGAETLSVRDKNREVVSMAQYRDVTMTFTDFARYFRNGQHFPEVPALNTKPGRKRLFSTERVRGSKVAEYLENLGSGSGTTSAVPKIEGYDSYQARP